MTLFLLLLGSGSSLRCAGIEKEAKPLLHYSISMADPSSHYFHVELDCSGWGKDTLDFQDAKMGARLLPDYELRRGGSEHLGKG